jgi:hypothetical protein
MKRIEDFDVSYRAKKPPSTLSGRTITQNSQKAEFFNALQDMGSRRRRTLSPARSVISIEPEESIVSI